jgi:hypothetical protein
MADHIQIGDINPRIQYSGDGSQTAFTYPFPIFVDADMEVYEDDVLQTITTHYTVAGAGDSSGGTVTFVTAPAADVVVTLLRNIAIERTSDFQESGEFRAKVINDELDKLTATAQQIETDQDRSLRLGPTDSATSTIIPNKALRSGKVLGFDDNGDPVASTTDLTDIESIATDAAASAAAAAISETNAGDDATATAADRIQTALDAAAALAAAASVTTFSYQGTWNADTNTPTLADGVGTQGYYYVVGSLGTTTIDGATDWQAGDWIVFNGTTWDKVDNNEPTASETVSGLVELASQAEVDEGADTSRAVTPATLAAYPGLAAAKLAQVVSSQDGAVATGTTVMPVDDTIPQNTEGDEYLSLAITPTNASSTLAIEVSVMAGNGAGNTTLAGALFQDSTTGALAARANYAAGARPEHIDFTHIMTAGTISSTTFKVRIGASNAGTTTVNGETSSRYFGGVATSSIKITEYLP